MRDIPPHIIDRLLILNPEYESSDAREAIEGLYKYPASWLPLCHKFNIPKFTVQRWRDMAAVGHDVIPQIDLWLGSIGVTQEIPRKRVEG